MLISFTRSGFQPLVISILQLGTLDYATALRLQQSLVSLRKEGRIGDVLLLLEHTPVITLGRNAKAPNVLASPEQLAEKGVEVYDCDRGGDVTFHGPGQLVGYPILDLRGFASAVGKRKTMGAIEYVRCLEEVLIRTCADFGIAAERVPGLTGVWTQVGTGEPKSQLGASQKSEIRRVLPAAQRRENAAHGASRGSTARNAQALKGRQNSCRAASAAPVHADGKQSRLPTEIEQAKIAAIGVHISSGVTSHGFALNVNVNLDYFNLIVPCGITTKPVTSMAKALGKLIPPEEVTQSAARNFGVVFHREIQWLETLDALLGNTDIPMKLPTELRRIRKEEDTFWA
jgi:lipoate-protein ligase B